jgi:hypothetical protein
MRQCGQMDASISRCDCEQTLWVPQEGNWSKWRQRKARVDKDVVRTDRQHPYFAGPTHSPAAPTAVTATLRSILLSYTLYHWDLGYCQGMSDLLSPVLFVVRRREPSEHQLRVDWLRQAATSGRLTRARDDHAVQVRHEADAFWCFVAVMERVQANFHHDERGMHAQLQAVRGLLELLDPELHAHLVRADCVTCRCR